MVTSERYERDVLKRLRGLQDAPDDRQIAAIGAVFSSCLAHLPEPLRVEILAWYTECYGRGDERVPTTRALALRLATVIDVYDRSYDPGRTPLEEDEWELIRFVTNQHSPQMDLETLRSVMQLLMDRGVIG